MRTLVAWCARFLQSVDSAVLYLARQRQAVAHQKARRSGLVGIMIWLGNEGVMLKEVWVKGEVELHQGSGCSVRITQEMLDAAIKVADFHADLIRDYGMPEEAIFGIILAALEAAPRGPGEDPSQHQMQLR